MAHAVAAAAASARRRQREIEIRTRNQKLNDRKRLLMNDNSYVGKVSYGLIENNYYLGDKVITTTDSFKQIIFYIEKIFRVAYANASNDTINPPRCQYCYRDLHAFLVTDVNPNLVSFGILQSMPKEKQQYVRIVGKYSTINIRRIINSPFWKLIIKQSEFLRLCTEKEKTFLKYGGNRLKKKQLIENLRKLYNESGNSGDNKLPKLGWYTSKTFIKKTIYRRLMRDITEYIDKYVKNRDKH